MTETTNWINVNPAVILEMIFVASGALFFIKLTLISILKNNSTEVFKTTLKQKFLSFKNQLKCF